MFLEPLDCLFLLVLPVLEVIQPPALSATTLNVHSLDARQSFANVGERGQDLVLEIRVSHGYSPISSRRAAAISGRSAILLAHMRMTANVWSSVASMATGSEKSCWIRTY